MFWHRKPATADIWGVEIRKAQHQLWQIERELGTFDHRADVDRLRKLTGRHAAWVEFLRSHDIHHPAPLVRW